MKPKISVITVCLNAVDTIERTIMSVLSQNYDNLEYIIIDGKSTDGTVDIIDKYKKDISYVISENDSGIYDAMNKGISKATGEIVAILNSDDWYEPDIFDYVADIFENRDIEIICGGMNIYFNGMFWYCNNKKVDSNELLVSMIYDHSSTFVRRKLFTQYGLYNTKYKIAADYEWYLRVYCKGIKIDKCYKVLSNFSWGGLSTTDNLGCAQETRDISLEALEHIQWLNEIEKNKVRKEILDRYFAAERNAYIEQYISGEIEINKDIAKGILSPVGNGKYSLFGAGKMSVKCIKLLRRLGVSIDCIWDNAEDKKGTIIDNIEVREPVEIKNWEGIIIIASDIYAQEMESQIKKIAPLKNVRCIRYSDICKEIAEAINEKW